VLDASADRSPRCLGYEWSKCNGKRIILLKDYSADLALSDSRNFAVRREFKGSHIGRTESSEMPTSSSSIARRLWPSVAIHCNIVICSELIVSSIF
jgi:hypothetical protein